MTNREQSEADFQAMLGHIHRLIKDDIRRGMRPLIARREVWLGPHHQRVLTVELNWQQAEGRLVHTAANVDRLIRNDVEGVQLLGLTVRKSGREGIGPVQ